MNESDILNQLTAGSHSGGLSTISPDKLLSPQLQSQLSWLLWVSIAVSVFLALAFVVYLIYKIRAQSAIMRIDRNLQKLVDAQGLSDIDPKKQHPTPAPESTA